MQAIWIQYLQIFAIFVVPFDGNAIYWKEKQTVNNYEQNTLYIIYFFALKYKVMNSWVIHYDWRDVTFVEISQDNIVVYRPRKKIGKLFKKFACNLKFKIFYAVTDE